MKSTTLPELQRAAAANYAPPTPHRALAMTWYADEILLPATGQALAHLSRCPALLPFAYWVKTLEAFQWYSAEHRHALPANGLLVLRPICDPGSHGGSWYQAPVVDWSSFDEPDLDDAYLQPDVERRLADYLGEAGPPPQGLRRFLAAFASKTATPLVYYACAMWGGLVDSEYSLMYSPNESFCCRGSELFEREGDSPDALRAGLASIGLEIPTSFFALHTREFPWDAHRLQPLGEYPAVTQ